MKATIVAKKQFAMSTLAVYLSLHYFVNMKCRNLEIFEDCHCFSVKVVVTILD